MLHELAVHQTELETQNDELRRARGEIEAGLASYRELFDFAPIGYATIDEKDVIEAVNHAGVRTLAVPRDALVGKRFGTLIAPEDVIAFNALVAKARAYEGASAGELRLRVVQRPLVIRLTASRQPRTTECLLLAFEDISERRTGEERLAATERALREANQRKDEFLAMLSHELRNPLAPIRTSLFVMSAAEPGTPAANESREIIERQVAHLTRIVDDLLDVTRIARGKIHLRRERLDLVELVDRTVVDHHAAFEHAGLSLVVQGIAGPQWVDADPTRMVQIVSNLLGNALKFTPHGGRVTVALERRGDFIEIRVRDTGAGIPPQLLPHLFEPFTQAPQAIDRSSGGLGLGLAMVQGLVRLHGGSVSIASEGTGCGAQVTLSIPLASAPATRVAAPLPRLGARRVLVIEDQRDSSRALEQALTLLGLEVRTAASGPAGLDVAREFAPEVVLCDIGLPGMDGYAVANAFRDDPRLREIFLVALSGYAQPDDIERSKAAGFMRHVAKPASLDALVRAIAAAPSLGRFTAS